MKHQQVVDKLAAAGLVQAVDEELARWVARRMLAPGATARPDYARRVVDPVLARWRCLLDSPDASEDHKDVARVALATLLHKYGFQDADTTEQAVRAVDGLNERVVLSDAFARQADAVKALLTSAPTPLSRKPATPRRLTFHRPGDVLAIRWGGRFHGAHVLEVRGLNQAAVIEFYAGSFPAPPEPADLADRPAAAARGRARFQVDGLTYFPDPARQVLTVATAQQRGPTGGEPGPGDGLYALTDLLALPDDAARLFERTG